MKNTTAIERHREQTKLLARSLKPKDVYLWLLTKGYFPENYVLPPCFHVVAAPKIFKRYFQVPRKRNGNRFAPDRTESVKVHFPKSEYTDRTFGIVHPHIHNDIAYDISKNWKKIVDALIPSDSMVTAYSFPLPISKKNPGRVGRLRAGRMIYEFIDMTDEDLVSVAFRYTHIVKADIKNFYPSIYTHSIAWALHGKSKVRKNIHNYKLLGNRLDKLFQNANDGVTNGLPIGPVVSDIAAEIIAAAVDRELTRRLKMGGIQCEAVRFKDDYRILVKSDGDARSVIKALQSSMKEFNLELSDEKTKIALLPTGLFREWVSRYHAIHPRKLRSYSWKQFRELYVGVVEIDRACPGTGVIDRFLADIVSDRGFIKLEIEEKNLERAVSMLLMLGSLRIKAFPKIMAILESIMNSRFGLAQERAILAYLESYLRSVSIEEERNKYIISWLLYFLVSKGFYRGMIDKPKFKNQITSSIASNRPLVFKNAQDFKLFRGCMVSGREVTLMRYLDVFNPQS